MASVAEALGMDPVELRIRNEPERDPERDVLTRLIRGEADGERLTGHAGGDEDAGLLQLFAGLNPERIMASAFSTGMARLALGQDHAMA